MHKAGTWNAAQVGRIFGLKPATLSLWIRNGHIDGLRPVGKGKLLSFDIEALLWVGLLLEFRRLGFHVERASQIVRRLSRTAGDLSDVRITMKISPGDARASDITVFDARRYLASRRAPEELQEALAQ